MPSLDDYIHFDIGVERRLIEPLESAVGGKILDELGLNIGKDARKIKVSEFSYAYILI